jgi:hypothetical protein
MTNKIRLLFIIIVFVISVVSILIFNNFQVPLESKIQPISEFKLTQISGNGKIYFDKNPIDDSGYFSAGVVNIKQMKYTSPIYFKADEHTAFEFYCYGKSFIVLPHSYFYYHPDKNEFHLYSGEFYWSKNVKGNTKKISFYVRDPQNVLTLSDSGRIKIKDDLIEIWNYSRLKSSKTGEIIFNHGDSEQTLTLKPIQMMVIRKDKPPEIFDILPFPKSIDPEEKVIELKNPEDSVVRFNWKSVPGANQYIFRLYSSNLKENILVEKTTQLSWLNLDLLQFEEREFYWQIFPINIDEKEQWTGIPSTLGHLQIVGSLLDKKDIQKLPQLSIKSLTVNGNLVIIKGNAESDSQLYINDELVKIDTDGEFIHYLTFKRIGPKRISFRIISPLGTETTEDKYVTIYAE